MANTTDLIYNLMLSFNKHAFEVNERLTNIENRLTVIENKFVVPTVTLKDSYGKEDIKEIGFDKIEPQEFDKGLPVHGIYSSIPPENREVSWEKYLTKINPNIKNMYNLLNDYLQISVDEFKKRPSVAFSLEGQAGCGKTQLCISFLRSISKLHYRCFFVQPKDIYDTFYKISINNNIIEKALLQYQVIVFDDFNTERKHINIVILN